MNSNAGLSDKTKETIEGLVVDYLKEHFHALFTDEMENALPALRGKILNISGYMTPQEAEELNNKIGGLEKENARLLKDLAEKQKNLDIAMPQLEKLTVEHRELGKQFERETRKRQQAEESCKKRKAELEAVTAERNYYASTYAALDEAYEGFLSLNDSLRYQLAGIFGGGETVQGFFGGAVQEKHIGDFWEFLRYSLNEGKLSRDETKILCGMFDFCFRAMNDGGREPAFIRMKTAKGARYDEDTMTLTSDSPQLGRVKEVLLEGYNNRKGLAVHQSLVRLGE